MTGRGNEAMQVIYIEMEGIKIAIELAKDAVRIAWQLAKFLTCSLSNTKYKKTMGKTNMKNLSARANGQPLVPFTMDREAYAHFKKAAKKYGILYHAFRPLQSGKDGSMQILFAEKDLPMVQEVMSRIKEKRIREDVKNGMTEEKSAQEFAENNHTETMEEFTENAGAATPEEVFEAEMKEHFGEDYKEKMLAFLKQKEEGEGEAKTAGADQKKWTALRKGSGEKRRKKN